MEFPPFPGRGAAAGAGQCSGACVSKIIQGFFLFSGSFKTSILNQKLLFEEALLTKLEMGFPAVLPWCGASHFEQNLLSEGISLSLKSLMTLLQEGDQSGYSSP